MNPGVLAAACFYATDIHKRSLGKGMHDDSLDRAGEIKGEILHIWGRQDPHVPLEGRNLIKARLEDVVARWSDGQTYPPVTGLIIRVGRRLAFVPASAIDRIAHAEVLLRSSRLDLRDVVRRPEEVLLAKDGMTALRLAAPSALILLDS